MNKNIYGIFVFAVIICLAVLPGNLFAQNRAGAYSLSLHAGEYDFDDSQDILNGPVYGIGLGYNYTKHIGVEAVFDHINAELEGSKDDVDGNLYRIDGLYHFMPEKKFVPYIAAGAGVLTLDSDKGGSDTDAILNYGAGIKYFLTEDLAFRADIRHVIPIDDEGTNLAYTFGLTYLFGGKAEPVIVPMDSDGDGVIDDLDRCPGTPSGVPVDEVGCPKDTDGDGVYDYMDQCPGTPEGINVDSKGCPVPIKEKVSIELLVEFDTDKAYIRPMYNEHLKKVANFLKAYPDTRAVIEGHTDSRASEKYNQNLSARRAESVMRYLVNNFGIDQSRLSAVGYGESRPIADNNSKEGMQRNRRVIAVISTVITR